MESNYNILPIIEKNREIQVPNLYNDVNNSKGIKRFLKKAVYKSVSWLFHPLLDFLQLKTDANIHILHNLNQYAIDLEKAVIAHKAAIEKLTVELRENEYALMYTRRELNEKLGSIARDTIRTKWRFMDYILSMTDNSDREIQCGICKYKNDVKTFETIETDCIFEGGHLVRYICPDCGVIFGPLKFSDLNEQEFDDDYTVHYSGFSEGDSTDKEIAAFMQLRPEKGKSYLNYGCGSWSSSIEELHNDGYIIYGYDPYSNDSKGNPYIITDREELGKMRFDGLFSNNLLEHLPDPAKELEFMKSLLNRPTAKMAHSTGCYKYMFEFTRFHMYFFTGRSLDIISENAGLTYGELIKDEKWEDFLCYVFSRKEAVPINYLPKMLLSGEGEVRKGEIIIKPAGIMHGPYIMLPKGEYKLRMVIDIADDTNEFTLAVTVGNGKDTIFEADIVDGENIIDIVLTETYHGMEFAIHNNSTDKEIVINAIETL